MPAHAGTFVCFNPRAQFQGFLHLQDDFCLFSFDF